MFHFFKNQKKLLVHDDSDEPKKDKKLWIAIAFLAAFIVFSLITGIAGGTFQKLELGFRFHFTDGAAIIALGVAYLIYRLRKGGNHGG